MKTMEISTLLIISPELWILGMACVLLIADLFLSKVNRLVAYYLGLVTLFGAMILILNLVGGGREDLFFNSFVRDDLSSFLEFVICFLGVFVFMYGRNYVDDHKMPQGDYYALSLFSILGMMVLVSAASLLTLYLGVELLALPLYALISLSKDKRAPEAAMKYFVMGALASGMLLYGISLLYGATGSFEIKIVAEKLIQQTTLPPMIISIGMVLVLVGLAFKLGAVPFHMWVPDIYEGSAACMTLFIATLPEIAGFGMAIRLLVDTFTPLTQHWQQIWMVMAVLSIVLGNVVAIAQTNFKRMLAYSSIGHMGFVFLGLLVGPEVGFGPALAYIVIYAVMALGAFGIMVALSYRGFEAESLADFRGLGKSQPWVALMMLLVLFSLAGVPPTIGFYAKFLVLNAVIEAGFTELAVLAVIFTVVGAFYYLRIIRLMFFDKVEGEAVNVLNRNMTQDIENIENSAIYDRSDYRENRETYKMPACKKVPFFETALLSLNGLGILALGLYPAPLISVCMAVFKG